MSKHLNKNSNDFISSAVKINGELLEDFISEVMTDQDTSFIIDCQENDNNLEKNIPQMHEYSSDDLLIFGYGSLVWKADFPFVERMGGFIKGFERRFYQNSIDHRGNAEKPGRVVTLIPSSDPNSKVWGIAYKIAPENREAVLRHLDYREKNGYSRHETKFFKYNFNEDEINDPGNILLYLATVDNESFNDESDLEKIADQIYYAEGISGTNREYVYKLANAMRTHYPGNDDEHLFALEAILKKRENKFGEIEKSITQEISSCIKFALDNGLPFDNVFHIVNTITNKFKKESYALEK